MPLPIEPWQDKGWDALAGPATHVLLAGGARSGKTYLIVKAMVSRALQAPEATQVSLRLRFNHLKASIIYDTLPTVCKNEYPEYPSLYHLNKSDWFAEFVNGHRWYFGGLDDKERTEKILGQGHSTIHINECSQVSYSSRLKAITRLSQNKGLRLKAYYDENPPIQGHWTHRIWVKGLEPATGQKLSNPSAYAFCQMNPADNPHLPPETLEILRNLPKRERDRFYLGLFGAAVDGPLWTYEGLDSCRVDAVVVKLVKVVVAIDPSGCRGLEDTRSDEVGIVVAGLGDDGVVYVLEDCSGRYGPGGPEGWGARAVRAFHRWQADSIVAESNFGGGMVGMVIHTADANVPFREVKASRGKAVRAEPAASLYDRGLVKHVGPGFPELEEQLLQFSTSGYNGEKSPDRADALVWAVFDLAIEQQEGMGVLQFYRTEAARARGELPARSEPEARDDPQPWEKPATVVKPAVMLNAPEGLTGVVYARSGARYVIDSGRVFAECGDVDDLIAIGFRRPSSK